MTKSAFTHTGSGSGCNVIKWSLSHVVRSGRNAGAGSEFGDAAGEDLDMPEVGTTAGLSVTMFLNESFHTKVKSCR